MTLLYNTAQILIIAIFWPLFLLIILLKPKYRKRIPKRLGLGMNRKARPGSSEQKTFWIHALSVGEVTSSLPLVTGIRQTYPESSIVVTVATQTGARVAEDLLSSQVDLILASPLDILPVVYKYIHHIQPDLFILVETDFWPNLLVALNRKKIPTLLVNGRISQKSFAAYRKLSFFFGPMFRSFNHLCMQTASDAQSMLHFGVSNETLHTLGNLKYDTPAKTAQPMEAISKLIPQDRLVLVAGSTHRGEEEILLSAYQRLLHAHPELFFIIAPRNPERAAEIKQLADKHELHAVQRSTAPAQSGDLLIVDTIGELVEFYRHAAIAFVGGSLVAEGGHNPIEPAVMGIPVLFGPHMDDFREVSRDLIEAGAAQEVSDLQSLQSTLRTLLSRAEDRRAMGRVAEEFIQRQHGVVPRHIELIKTLL